MHPYSFLGRCKSQVMDVHRRKRPVTKFSHWNVFYTCIEEGGREMKCEAVEILGCLKFMPELMEWCAFRYYKLVVAVKPDVAVPPSQYL